MSINQPFVDITKADVQHQAWNECLKEIDLKRFQAVFSQLPTTYNLNHGPPPEDIIGEKISYLMSNCFH